MIRITVDGDAAGGWSVDIHDGERSEVYSPEAETALMALSQAVDAHWKCSATWIQDHERAQAALGDAKAQDRKEADAAVANNPPAPDTPSDPANDPQPQPDPAQSIL